MKQAQRIQKSIINGLERKALGWLARRQPQWVTSDMLTAVGVLGALMVATGFVLSNKGIDWLWLSSLGMIVNWYGDSLDGTLARVRDCQRPVYGYYLDHMIDCFNEAAMFVGAGLSPFLRLDIAVMAYALYLALTVNVSINAHLKGEFRLTFIKMGPTEYRLIVILMNTMLIALPALREHEGVIMLMGVCVHLSVLDYVAVVIVGIMAIILLATFVVDLRKYASIDPPKRK
ncbi:MAG: CDP-alcohol phosphatidyltransferase family protein [Bacteroidales bacterium]|nr:CDP-alcohol phosphatidyltransferase family protein [Bacteroidales bacterium]